MADVTISQLTQGVPSGNNILPYSTGSNTLGVPVSAIFQNSSFIGINNSNPTKPLHLTYDPPSSLVGGNDLAHFSIVSPTVGNAGVALGYWSDGTSKLGGMIRGTGALPLYISTSSPNAIAMTVSNVGTIAKPLQPFLYVSRRNAGSYNYTAGNNSDNITPVIYSTVEQQRGEDSYNPSTGKYTAPASGLYMIEAGVNRSNGPVTQLWAVQNTSRLQTFGASSYSTNIAFGTTLAYLNLGDTFNVSLFTPAINSINIVENYFHTFMRIAFLG